MHVRRIIGVLVLAILILGLGACAPKATPAPAAPTPTTTPAPRTPSAPSATAPAGEWDKIMAAGAKEGTVTIYNVLGADLSQALKEGMKKYGITVETIGGTGGELEQRIKTEQRAKAYVADILITGWTNNLTLKEAGMAEPVTTVPALREKDVWRISPSKYDSTNSAFVFATAVTPSIIVNTELVRKGEIQSWQDLLDPRWRDRMVMTDPRTGSGPGTSGLGFWMPLLGEDFWTKLATQRLSLQGRYDLVIEQVVHGERSIGILPALSRTVAAIKQGAPLQIVHLKEGTIHSVRGVNVVKNAPHPNAALAVFNWMFTKEGQAAVNRAMDTYSIRSDVTEDWIRIAELIPGRFTFLDPPANIDLEGPAKGVAFAKKLFGER